MVAREANTGEQQAPIPIGSPYQTMPQRQDNKSQIGDLIRQTRKAKGLTQAEFAELLGVTKSTVSGLESDRSSPSVQTLEKIASALSLTLKISLE